MRSWTARAAVTFGLWLVVALAAWVLGNAPRPGLLALVMGLGAGLLWLFVDVSGDAEAIRWPALAAEPLRSPGEDARLERLHRMLFAHQTAHHVDGALRDELARLADQKLLALHGVTREADPELARTLLGDELANLLTREPPYPRLTTAQIDQLLKRIESL